MTILVLFLKYFWGVRSSRIPGKRFLTGGVYFRIHSVKMTTASKSGHPTSCSSMAEIMSVLFFKVQGDQKNITVISVTLFNWSPCRYYMGRCLQGRIQVFQGGGGSIDMKLNKFTFVYVLKYFDLSPLDIKGSSIELYS